MKGIDGKLQRYTYVEYKHAIKLFCSSITGNYQYFSYTIPASKLFVGEIYY